MSKREDARYTTKGKRATVRLPNVQSVGSGKWNASPGDFVTFQIPDGERRHGRVIGRVDASGWDGGHAVSGWIAVVMLSVDLSFAHEFWIDPAWVTYCAAVAKHVEFFRAFFTKDPAELLRIAEYGSLGTQEYKTNEMPAHLAPGGES